MSSSPYASTEETTNLSRACRLLLGPCTDELRNVLKKCVNPAYLTVTIRPMEAHISRFLSFEQRDLVLPQGKVYTGNYNDMDISLLYTLLRSIWGCKQWNTNPGPTDRSVPANIERIHLARNKCGHSKSSSLSNKEFNTIWTTLRLSVKDLDKVFHSNFLEGVDFLLNETMDPVQEQRYREVIRKQYEEDQKTREIVREIAKQSEKTEEKVQEISDYIVSLKQSPVPSNVKAQHDNILKEWKYEDSVYQETHSFLSMMDKIRDQYYVTFVGVPGSGKSATAHHIALKLKEEGYEILPVENIKEIKDYCDIEKPQVFVIDDVVGVHGLQRTKLDLLRDYEKNIRNAHICNSIILMTCREVVFNEVLFYEPLFTKKQNMIKLHNSENALDENDKKLILQKYGLDVNFLSSSSLASASRMFPLLCKLYSGEATFRRFGRKFFIYPVRCILDQFDEMRREKNLDYASLVLCMINGGLISESTLENKENGSFINIKRDVLKNCKVESHTDTFKFIDALSAMEGTYTKNNGTDYTFVHDSIFETLAYHYGKQFPQQMLECMNSTYITNFVKPKKNEVCNVRKSEERMTASQSDDSEEKFDENYEKSNETEVSFDLCIRLNEDQYPLLAERLYRDIEKMELYDVFMNDVLKHPQVRRAFIDVLNGKRYTDVKSLFFKEMEAIEYFGMFESLIKGKPYNQLMRPLQKILWRSRHKASSLTRSKLLMSNTLRVISWVICYGHHEILQCLIKKTEEHRETNSVMFCENWWLQMFKSILRLIWRSFEYQEEKKRLLLLSCLSGDVDTLKILLQYVSRDYINLADTPEGWSTPLIVACEEGHACIVEELIKVGANVNLRDRFETPLTAACRQGHDNVVKELLKAKANVDLESEFDTPLTAACRGGYLNVVEKLLKVEGVDVNVLDIRGNTPLMNASLRGFPAVLKILLEYGAFCVKEVDIRVSALYAGLAMNNTEIVTELLQSEELKGIDGNTHLFNILVDIRKAAVKADCKGDVTETNRRVLHMESRGNWSMAILSEDSSVLRHLLHVGLDKNQLIQLYTDEWDGTRRESDLRPLLHVVIDEYNVNDRVEKIKILLEAGVNVNVKSKLNTTDPWFGTRKSRECNDVLDREGISALERTKTIINASARDVLLLTRTKTPEYREVMLKLKERVRRYSDSDASQ